MLGQQQHGDNITAENTEEQLDLQSQREQEISSHDSSHFPNRDISDTSVVSSSLLAKYLPGTDSNSLISSSNNTTDHSSEMAMKSHSMLSVLEELSLTEIEDDDGHHQRTRGSGISLSHSQKTTKITPLQFTPKSAASEDVKQSEECDEKDRRRESSTPTVTQSQSFSFSVGTEQIQDGEGVQRGGIDEGRWPIGGGAGGFKSRREQVEISGKHGVHRWSGGGKMRGRPGFRSHIPRLLRTKSHMQAQNQPLWKSLSFSPRVEKGSSFPILPSTRSEDDKFFVLSEHSSKSLSLPSCSCQSSCPTSQGNKQQTTSSHVFRNTSISPSLSSRLTTPPSHSGKLTTPSLVSEDKESVKEPDVSSPFYHSGKLTTPSLDSEDKESVKEPDVSSPFYHSGKLTSPCLDSEDKESIKEPDVSSPFYHSGKLTSPCLDSEDKESIKEPDVSSPFYHSGKLTSPCLDSEDKESIKEPDVSSPFYHSGKLTSPCLDSKDKESVKEPDVSSPFYSEVDHMEIGKGKDLSTQLLPDPTMYESASKGQRETRAHFSLLDMGLHQQDAVGTPFQQRRMKRNEETTQSCPQPTSVSLKSQSRDKWIATATPSQAHSQTNQDDYYINPIMVLHRHDNARASLGRYDKVKLAAAQLQGTEHVREDWKKMKTHITPMSVSRYQLMPPASQQLTHRLSPTKSHREDKCSPTSAHQQLSKEDGRDDGRSTPSYRGKNNVSVGSLASGGRMLCQNCNKFYLCLENQCRDSNEATYEDHWTSDLTHSGVSEGNEIPPSTGLRNHREDLCALSTASSVVASQISPAYHERKDNKQSRAVLTEVADLFQADEGNCEQQDSIQEYQKKDGNSTLPSMTPDVTLYPQTSHNLTDSLETPLFSLGSQNIDYQTSTSCSSTAPVTQREHQNRFLSAAYCLIAGVGAGKRSRDETTQSLATRKQTGNFANRTELANMKHYPNPSEDKILPQRSGRMTKAYMDCLRKDLERLKQQVIRSSQSHSSLLTNSSLSIPQNHTAQVSSSSSSPSQVLSSAIDFPSSTIVNNKFFSLASTRSTRTFTTCSSSSRPSRGLTILGASTAHVPHSELHRELQGLRPSEEHLDKPSNIQSVHTLSLCNSPLQQTSDITSFSTPYSLISSTQQSPSTLCDVTQVSNQLSTLSVRSPSHTNSMTSVKREEGGPNLMYSTRPLSKSQGSTPLRAPQPSTSPSLIGTCNSAFAMSQIPPSWPSESHSQQHWPSECPNQPSLMPISHSQPVWTPEGHSQPTQPSKCPNQPSLMPISHSQPVWTPEGHSQPIRPSNNQPPLMPISYSQPVWTSDGESLEYVSSECLSQLSLPSGSNSQPVWSSDGQQQQNQPSKYPSQPSLPSGSNSQPVWLADGHCQPSEYPSKPPLLPISHSQPIRIPDGHSQPTWPLEKPIPYQLSWMSNRSVPENSLPALMPSNSVSQIGECTQNPLSSTPTSLLLKENLLSSLVNHTAPTPSSSIQFASDGNTSLQPSNHTLLPLENVSDLITPLSSTAALSEGNILSLKSYSAPSLENFPAPLSSTPEGGFASPSTNSRTLSGGNFANISTPASSYPAISEGDTPSWTEANSLPSVENHSYSSSPINSTPILPNSTWCQEHISPSVRAGHGIVPGPILSPVSSNTISWGDEHTNTNCVSMDAFQSAVSNFEEADCNLATVLPVEHPSAVSSGDPHTISHDDSTLRLQEQGVCNTSFPRFSSPMATGRAAVDSDINEIVTSVELPEDELESQYRNTTPDSVESTLHKGTSGPSAHKRYSLTSEANSTEDTPGNSYCGPTQRRCSSHTSFSPHLSERDRKIFQHYEKHSTCCSNSTNNEEDNGGVRLGSKDGKGDNLFSSAGKLHCYFHEQELQLSGPAGARRSEGDMNHEQTTSPSLGAAHHSYMSQVSNSHKVPLQLSHTLSSNPSGIASSHLCSSHDYNHNSGHLSSTPPPSSHTHSSVNHTERTFSYPTSNNRSLVRSSNPSDHSSVRSRSPIQYSHSSNPSEHSSIRSRSPIQYSHSSNPLEHALKFSTSSTNIHRCPTRSSHSRNPLEYNFRDPCSSHQSSIRPSDPSEHVLHHSSSSHRSPIQSSEKPLRHTFSDLFCSRGLPIRSSLSSKPMEYTFSHRFPKLSGNCLQDSSTQYSTKYPSSDRVPKCPSKHVSNSSQTVSNSSHTVSTCTSPLWMPQAKPSYSSLPPHVSVNLNIHSPSREHAPEKSASRTHKKEYREIFSDERRLSEALVNRQLSSPFPPVSGDHQHSRHSFMENRVDYSGGIDPRVATIGTRFSPSHITNAHHSTREYVPPFKDSYDGHFKQQSIVGFPKPAKNMRPSGQQAYELKTVVHNTGSQDSLCSSVTAYDTAHLNTSHLQQHGVSQLRISHSLRCRYSPGYARGCNNVDNVRKLKNQLQRKLIINKIANESGLRVSREDHEDNQHDREGGCVQVCIQSLINIYRPHNACCYCMYLTLHEIHSHDINKLCLNFSL